MLVRVHCTLIGTGFSEYLLFILILFSCIYTEILLPGFCLQTNGHLDFVIEQVRRDRKPAGGRRNISCVYICIVTFLIKLPVLHKIIFDFVFNFLGRKTYSLELLKVRFAYYKDRALVDWLKLGKSDAVILFFLFIFSMSIGSSVEFHSAAFEGDEIGSLSISSDNLQLTNPCATSTTKKSQRKNNDCQAKRNRSSNNSSSSYPPEKISKVGSMDVDETVKVEKRKKVIILHKNHPTTTIKSEHFDKISRFISVCRSNYKLGEKLGMGLVKIDDIDITDDGTMSVMCADAFTAEWVKRLSFKIEGVPNLTIYIDDDEMENLGRCTILVKRREEKYKHAEFLNQMVAGNPGLVIKKLILRERKYIPEDSKHMVLVFSIDSEAIEWLRTRKGVVRFDLKKTKVFYPGYQKEQNEAKRARYDEI